jgi:hypothetical protein
MKKILLGLFLIASTIVVGQQEPSKRPGLYDQATGLISNVGDKTTNFFYSLAKTFKLPDAWEFATTSADLFYKSKLEPVLDILGEEAFTLLMWMSVWPTLVTDAIVGTYRGAGANALQTLGVLATVASAATAFLIGPHILLRTPHKPGAAPKELFWILNTPGIALYLGSAAYRAYLTVMETWTDTIDKAEAGTLTEKDIEDAKHIMQSNTAILAQEAEKKLSSPAAATA